MQPATPRRAKVPANRITPPPTEANIRQLFRVSSLFKPLISARAAGG
jgi:hypothetical protein